MENATLDLKKEQQSTLNTPRYKYSFMARFFFFSMDMVAGKKDTLPKAKMLEILACIPYREWEFRHYFKQTRKYKNLEKVKKAQVVIDYGRHAQDNEYTHLLVIHEKMKEEGMKDPWYLNSLVTWFAVAFYVLVARMLAFFSQKRAFLFNAEFENHAEKVYALMVENNPQWEEQKVTNALVKKYANVDSWADVFRRISLDERDHMNHSFQLAQMPQHVHSYEGMPKGVNY